MNTHVLGVGLGAIFKPTPFLPGQSSAGERALEEIPGAIYALGVLHEKLFTDRIFPIARKRGQQHDDRLLDGLDASGLFRRTGIARECVCFFDEQTTLMDVCDEQRVTHIVNPHVKPLAQICSTLRSRGKARLLTGLYALNPDRMEVRQHMFFFLKSDSKPFIQSRSTWDDILKELNP